MSNPDNPSAAPAVYEDHDSNPMTAVENDYLCRDTGKNNKVKT